jgi:hypothetical protein
MTKLIDDIRRATRGMKCRIHNQSAEISARGDSVEYKCCCEDFKNKIQEVAGKAAHKSAENQIRDMFKKFGAK